MLSHKQWEALSYRDLQHSCKAAGVSAKGTRAELIARLVEADGQPVTAPEATPRPARPARTLAAGKTPARRLATDEAEAALEAAAATALPLVATGDEKKQLQEREQHTPAPASRKAAASEALLAAMKTPLPSTPPKEDGLQSPQAATAARRRLRHGGAPRGGAAGLGSVLALAALMAAVAAVVVPAWHKYDCGGQLRGRFPQAMRHADRLAGQGQELAGALLLHARSAVPEPLSTAAAEWWEAGRAAHERHWQAAQRQCTFLWQAVQRWWKAQVQSWAAEHAEQGQGASEPAAEPEPAAPSCLGLLNTGALDSIVPGGDLWDNLKQTAVAAWQGAKADPSKASGMLFACVDQNCPLVNDWLAWAAGSEECVLRLEAAELGDNRGALQKRLAAFLSQQPRGVVLVADLHQLSAELVPVLINALSEQGAFEQDGRSVPAAGATFLLSMEMPREVLDAESEAAFKVNAKALLVQTLAQRSAKTEEALTVAKALRRRIEYVLPTLY